MNKNNVITLRFHAFHLVKTTYLRSYAEESLTPTELRRRIYAAI